MKGSIKENRRRGFTMAELLIVVAIIAVLVAIAIPVFVKKIEKAREAYDIYTMRQAATAAINLYYAGVHDKTSAEAAGMTWWKSNSSDTSPNANAAGAYNPKTGEFIGDRKKLPADVKMYGKGTKINGGTVYLMGNPNGAYAANCDYTKACVMVSIYPNRNPVQVEVYWKNNNADRTQYVGDQAEQDMPNYSIRLFLN